MICGNVLEVEPDCLRAIRP